MSWVTVAIGGMTAMNQITAGNTAKGQAYLQAQADDFAAKKEQEAALETANLIRKAGRRQVGQANAAFAAAGVKVGEGSAGEVEREINLDVEHDAFQTILEGDRRALGLKTQGAFARAQGNAAQKAGYVNAAGSLLSTYGGTMKASGWRTGTPGPGESYAPGFSGQQAPAPVESRYVPKG